VSQVENLDAVGKIVLTLTNAQHRLVSGQSVGVCTVHIARTTLYCTLWKRSHRARGFNLISGDTRRTKLLVGLSRHRRRHRLFKLQMDFGVKEILDLLNLQASVFVSGDVHNDYGLVGRSHPD
jgi:hypothetical protein